MPSTSRRAWVSERIRSNLEKQNEIEKIECELAIYRKSCSQGAAVVRLSDLKCDTDFSRHITNHRNVDRLEKIFDYQGFLRLQEKYHIPVMIDTSDWQERVKWEESATLAPQAQLPQLQVDDGYRFFVLDHEDVIAAAKKRFKELDVEDPWCVVDIYVTNARDACNQREELIRSLQESYSNDHFPSDGLIYRKIRHYQGYPNVATANTVAENYWWAVLESSPGSKKGGRSKKGAYLRSLLDNENLRESFDDLLPINGLWDGMNIGVLHKLMAMKTEEPIICYLRKIKDTFYGLTGGDQEILGAIDAETIKKIKSRAPKVSEVDLKLGLHERPDDIDLQDLEHHFLWLAHQRGFKVPADELQYVELPRVIPGDFPPDNEDDKDVSVERRSGKPFTDSVNADRFALSRCSLQSTSDFDRVSAGFVRRSVFKAFFDYFDSGIPGSPVPSPPPSVAESPPDEIDNLLADIESAIEADRRQNNSHADAGFTYGPHAVDPIVPQYSRQDRHGNSESAAWGQQGDIDPFQQANQCERQAVAPAFRIVIDVGKTPEVLLLPSKIEGLMQFVEDYHRMIATSIMRDTLT
ncbi:uncharacterized protein N7511_004320 [Penicillium nucicola]|uniref:uncharacterized protein n=1 Tax=Penicillium nucicola TaxID=1850975 RepID=UPI0025452320|nr:uncharacterized protein N7511_004320 [Penicillium nucicola]KAJ5766704.1 hypothetical protein N7511_004320 [Penicillium nucicola]